jgi:hypothetical protein
MWQRGSKKRANTFQRMNKKTEPVLGYVSLMEIWCFLFENKLGEVV